VEFRPKIMMVLIITIIIVKGHKCKRGTLGGTDSSGRGKEEDN
jgi:hypothetical protein